LHSRSSNSQFHFIDPATGDLGMVVGMLASGSTLGAVQPVGTVRNYLSAQTPISPS
jgi:hypothetical protein